MREYDLAKQHMQEQQQYAENTRLLPPNTSKSVRERLSGLFNRNVSVEWVGEQSSLNPSQSIPTN